MCAGDRVVGVDGAVVGAVVGANEEESVCTRYVLHLQGIYHANLSIQASVSCVPTPSKASEKQTSNERTSCLRLRSCLLLVVGHVYAYPWVC